MTHTAYDKTTVKREEALPDEEKTEERGLTIDVRGEGYYYDDYPITEVHWWFDRVGVIYQYGDREDQLERLGFGCEVEDDGTIRITGNAVGLVAPEPAREMDSPGANSSEQVFDMLEDLGFVLDIPAEDW